MPDFLRQMMSDYEQEEHRAEARRYQLAKTREAYLDDPKYAMQDLAHMMRQFVPEKKARTLAMGAPLEKVVDRISENDPRKKLAQPVLDTFQSVAHMFPDKHPREVLSAITKAYTNIDRESIYKARLSGQTSFFGIPRAAMKIAGKEYEGDIAPVKGFEKWYGKWDAEQKSKEGAWNEPQKYEYTNPLISGGIGAGAGVATDAITRFGLDKSAHAAVRWPSLAIKGISKIAGAGALNALPATTPMTAALKYGGMALLGIADWAMFDTISGFLKRTDWGATHEYQRMGAELALAGVGAAKGTGRLASRYTDFAEKFAGVKKASEEAAAAVVKEPSAANILSHTKAKGEEAAIEGELKKAGSENAAAQMAVLSAELKGATTAEAKKSVKEKIDMTVHGKPTELDPNDSLAIMQEAMGREAGVKGASGKDMAALSKEGLDEVRKLTTEQGKTLPEAVSIVKDKEATLAEHYPDAVPKDATTKPRVRKSPSKESVAVLQGLGYPESEIKGMTYVLAKRFSEEKVPFETYKAAQAAVAKDIEKKIAGNEATLKELKVGTAVTGTPESVKNRTILRKAQPKAEASEIAKEMTEAEAWAKTKAVPESDDELAAELVKKYEAEEAAKLPEQKVIEAAKAKAATGEKADTTRVQVPVVGAAKVIAAAKGELTGAAKMQADLKALEQKGKVPGVEGLSVEEIKGKVTELANKGMSPEGIAKSLRMDKDSVKEALAGWTPPVKKAPVEVKINQEDIPAAKAADEAIAQAPAKAPPATDEFQAPAHFNASTKAENMHIWLSKLPVEQRVQGQAALYDLAERGLLDQAQYKRFKMKLQSDAQMSKEATASTAAASEKFKKDFGGMTSNDKRTIVGTEAVHTPSGPSLGDITKLSAVFTPIAFGLGFDFNGKGEIVKKDEAGNEVSKGPSIWDILGPSSAEAGMIPANLRGVVKDVGTVVKGVTTGYGAAKSEDQLLRELKGSGLIAEGVKDGQFNLRPENWQYAISINPRQENMISRVKRIPAFLQHVITPYAVGQILYAGRKSVTGGLEKLCNPSVEIAARQTAAMNNADASLKVFSNVMKQAGIETNFPEVARMMKPLEEKYAEDMSMMAYHYGWMDKQEKLIKQATKELGKKDLTAAERVEVTGRLGKFQEEFDKSAAAVKAGLPRYKEMKAEWEPLMQELSKKHASTRVALAAEDDAAFTKFPWLKDMMSKDELWATGKVKELMGEYALRMAEVGEKPILNEAYMHHAIHPDRNWKKLQDRFETIGVEGNSGVRLAGFHARSTGSLQMMPDVHYIMAKYLPETSRRVQMVDFWKKDKPTGWWAHMNSDVVKDSPALSKYWRDVNSSFDPVERTTMDQWARRAYDLEIARLLALSPSVAFKHLVKLEANWSNFGIKESAKMLPRSIALLQRHLIEGSVPENLLDQAYKAHVSQGKLLSMAAEYDLFKVEDKVWDIWMRKFNEKGAFLINNVEKFDRGHSLLASMDMAGKQGMTAAQASYSVFDTILKTNFLSGAMNPGWLRDPKIRMMMMFMGTPYKIMEQRLVQAYKVGKDVGDLLGTFKAIRSDIKQGEYNLKLNLMKDALTREKDIFGTPVAQQLMRKMLILGTVVSTGRLAFDADLFEHVAHPPFVKFQEGNITLAMNPAIQAGYQAWHRKEQFEDDFWLSDFFKQWLKESPFQANFIKAARLSEGDIPERYKGSATKYLFGIPAMKD